MTSNRRWTQRGPLISPETYRRRLLGPLRAMADTAKRYGAHYYHHSCGSVRQLIPDLLETGVEVLDPLQVEAAGMSPATQRPLPDLPQPCAYGAAAMVGEVVYLAGGQSDERLETAMTNFWRLDLSGSEETWTWEVLPPWPRDLRITIDRPASSEGGGTGWFFGCGRGGRFAVARR